MADSDKAASGGQRGLMQEWLENFLASRPSLFRLIGRILRPDEIEDIVQETFLLSYAASRNQKILNPRAFMMRTARNLALNQVMRAERKLNCSFDEIESTEALSQIDSVESRCQSEERFLVFCRAVAELPVACRRVFILKKVYGLSQAEIAEYLKLSPSTVEKHVAKGMLMTAQYMLRQGHAVGVADESQQADYYPPRGEERT